FRTRRSLSKRRATSFRAGFLAQSPAWTRDESGPAPVPAFPIVGSVAVGPWMLFTVAGPRGNLTPLPYYPTPCGHPEDVARTMHPGARAVKRESSHGVRGPGGSADHAVHHELVAAAGRVGIVELPDITQPRGARQVRIPGGKQDAVVGPRLPEVGRQRQLRIH